VVRLSTQLFANRCVTSGSQGVGSCVASGTVAAPDGDRLGSAEATPSDNNGGAIGNWHDMGWCCTGNTYAGKPCNGQAFRTTSEYAAGWAPEWLAGQSGTFGSNSFATMTFSLQGTTPCATANYAKANGYDYDIAVYFGTL
jgi:hypothetical protein